jgi:hypothetical protein
MRHQAARHLTPALGATPRQALRWLTGSPIRRYRDAKQISIALAAGLLMAGVPVASATEMQRPFGARMPTQHNIYAGHNNAGSNNVAAAF